MQCELCPRGWLGPPEHGREGQLPLPRAGRETLQEKNARCLSAGLLLPPVLPGGRNARRIQQAQGRREVKPCPKDCPQSALL